MGSQRRHGHTEPRQHRRHHIVVANLTATPHRALEGLARWRCFAVCFLIRLWCACMPPPPWPGAEDEGAANHSRLAQSQAERGVHVFVYGRAHDTARSDLPRTFPARQTCEASQAVARLGHLAPQRAVFARQRPQAIDAGAFHNDVVMVATCDRILLHECSLVEQETVLHTLRQYLLTLQVFVRQRDLSLRQCRVICSTTAPADAPGYVLLAPQSSSGQRQGHAAASTLFIDHLMFQEPDQSMAGGGSSLACGAGCHSLPKWPAWHPRAMKPYCNSSRPGWISTIATSYTGRPGRLLRKRAIGVGCAHAAPGLGTLYAFQREGTSPCHPH